jgi:hypothetical protein
MLDRLADIFCCFIYSKNLDEAKTERTSKEINAEANVIVKKVLQDLAQRQSTELESQIKATDDTIIFTK